MRQVIHTHWTSVNCDACGVGDSDLELLGTRTGRIIQKQHDYEWRHEDVQCSKCGFVFNRLRPEAEFLRDYYSDCWPIASSSIAIIPDFDVEIRLNLLARWLKPHARVYEIGDKLGEFHTALTTAGYEVAGDDVMAEGSERYEWLDALFRRGCVATPPTPMREAFDAVLAYFVVEHLANPQHWLLSMRGLLSSNGILVIEVPHLRLHPKEALMHEHFLYLTPESLTVLVQKAGFEIVEVQEKASRNFGFSLVARRADDVTVTDAALRESADKLNQAYHQGRELLAQANASLMASAKWVSDALAGASIPARVCFFGANQTASEIAKHLRPLLSEQSIEILPFDNSDVKSGTLLEGFDRPIQKPTPADFASDVLHVCVICSRGWTQAIAEQIRGFALPHYLMIDGAAGQQLLS